MSSVTQLTDLPLSALQAIVQKLDAKEKLQTLQASKALQSVLLDCSCARAVEHCCRDGSWTWPDPGLFRAARWTHLTCRCTCPPQPMAKSQCTTFRCMTSIPNPSSSNITKLSLQGLILRDGLLSCALAACPQLRSLHLQGCFIPPAAAPLPLPSQPTQQLTDIHSHPHHGGADTPPSGVDGASLATGNQGHTSVNGSCNPVQDTTHNNAPDCASSHSSHSSTESSWKTPTQYRLAKVSMIDLMVHEQWTHSNPMWVSEPMHMDPVLECLPPFTELEVGITVRCIVPKCYQLVSAGQVLRACQHLHSINKVHWCGTHQQEVLPLITQLPSLTSLDMSSVRYALREEDVKTLCRNQGLQHLTVCGFNLTGSCTPLVCPWTHLCCSPKGHCSLHVRSLAELVLPNLQGPILIKSSEQVSVDAHCTVSGPEDADIPSETLGNVTGMLKQHGGLSWDVPALRFCCPPGADQSQMVTFITSILQPAQCLPTVRWLMLQDLQINEQLIIALADRVGGSLTHLQLVQCGMCEDLWPRISNHLPHLSQLYVKQGKHGCLCQLLQLTRSVTQTASATAASNMLKAQPERNKGRAQTCSLLPKKFWLPLSRWGPGSQQQEGSTGHHEELKQAAPGGINGDLQCEAEAQHAALYIKVEFTRCSECAGHRTDACTKCLAQQLGLVCSRTAGSRKVYCDLKETRTTDAPNAKSTHCRSCSRSGWVL